MIPDLRNTKESPGHSPVICRNMAGIVCFLLKIHPRRQCIRCLLLLFLGGDNRRAVALLGTVAAESGMTAAVKDRFGGGYGIERFDIYMDDESSCWEFGRQYVDVEIVGGI